MKTALMGLALSLGLAPLAAPDPPPTNRTLEELVAEALEGNPDIRAAAEAVAAARQRPAQATVLPDPVVSATFTNEGWTPNLGAMPGSNVALMASQAFPRPGERALRGQIAAADVRTAEQQLARVRLGVEADVRRAFGGLAEARALRTLAEEQAEVWTQIEAVARARYAVGQGVQQDVLRVQVELTRVGQLRIAQQAEEELRLAELARLRGREDGLAVETPPLSVVPRPAEPLADVLARLRALSPERAAAESGVARARLAVDLARVQFRPELAVQGGYMNRGGLDPMWQAGVSLSLPLRRDGRRAGLAEAEARLLSVQAQLRATDLLLRLRTQERVVQIRTAAELFVLYDQGIVPQAQMAVEAALASYRAGQVPFLTVLESLATLYGDRSTAVRLAAGHARARVSLEEASLVPTNDVSVPGAPMGTASMGAVARPEAAAGTDGPATPGAMAPMGGR